MALIAGGVLLALLGDNPFSFYANIWQYGINQGSWEDSAMRAAPLLLIAVGLIVVFRANIWNLGYDGQFLLGAALITGVAPHLESLPNALSLLILFALAMAAGAAWTIIPAILKARYQTNEIITTLMMSFIGVGVANILIKGPFQDPTVNIPQTRVIALDHMLPVDPRHADPRRRAVRARRRRCSPTTCSRAPRSGCACTSSAPTRAPPRTSASTPAG